MALHFSGCGGFVKIFNFFRLDTDTFLEEFGLCLEVFSDCIELHGNIVDKNSEAKRE